MILVLLSVIVRGFLAAFLEFGNDEVYYWTYALYPDLSHFDHPPMVGFLIQLTSLNLLLPDEFFIRLGSVLLGGVNTWMVYLIGKQLRDEASGIYAALLYTASIYAFIIAGTFILPDTPQLFFWFLSLYFLLRAFDADPDKRAGRFLLYAGFSTGMAMLSKYTSVFLVAGVLFYVVFVDRRWLKMWQLYAAGVIAMLLFMPVVAWNLSNDFISFTFHSERVGIFGSGLRGDFFFTELGGQMLYNNPVNFIIGVVALAAFFKKKPFIGRNKAYLLIFTSIPLILLFLFFSLFRHTLPHWTGPAWTTLILLSACYLSHKAGILGRKKLFPGWITASWVILAIVLTVGMLQVKAGLFYHDQGDSPQHIGQKDVSLDMYGWRQLSDEFAGILTEEQQKGNIGPNSPFISSRWFPAANIDYYLAAPNGMKVLGLGSLDALHKYMWMNEERGGFHMGMDAWFLTISRDFRDPMRMYGPWFEEVELAYTVPVYRNGKHVMNAYFYYLKGLKKMPKKINGT